MDTDENPPIAVGGHIQWSNLPTWGKWAGGAVAGFLLVAQPVWSHLRISKAEDDAKIAAIKARSAEAITAVDKKEADSGWLLLKPRIEALETWKHDYEVREARALAKRQRRPVVVVPPAPKPLPPTLKAAKEQVQKGPSMSPLPTPDGGA